MLYPVLGQLLDEFIFTETFGDPGSRRSMTRALLKCEMSPLTPCRSSWSALGQWDRGGISSTVIQMSIVVRRLDRRTKRLTLSRRFMRSQA